MMKHSTKNISDIAKTAFTPLYVRSKMGFELDIYLVEHSFEVIMAVNDQNVVIRTIKFDEFVKNFISKKPDAVIANFGAGFCTRFWRVDNGRVLWMNFDLKEIIDIRHIHFPEHERCKNFPCDFNKDSLKTKFDLIIAEGFFPYLQKSIALKHITGEIIFDLATKVSNDLIRWSYKGEKIDGLNVFSNDILTGPRASGSRIMYFIHAEPGQ